MANNLYIFDKTTNVRSLVGEIVNGFSLAENINGTPSNMKAIIVNAEQEEYEVNSIVYHDHTDTWWVINADTSTYLPNGTYKHEIELVEGFEWFNYRTMPDCAFKQGRYTLETMLQRLFKIAKIDCAIEFASFQDEDALTKFMAFTNMTVASALKQVASLSLGIPKLKWTNGSTLSGMTLYFVSRMGNDALTLITDIDTAFPVAYEQNASTSEQYKTRAVSNISNGKSQSLVLSPKIGGFQISTETSWKVESDDMSIILPSKIDKVEYIAYCPQVYIEYVYYEFGTPVTTYGIYNNYFFDTSYIRSAIMAYVVANGQNIDADDVNDMDFPDTDWIKVSYGDVLALDTGYVDNGNPLSGAKLLYTKREYDEIKDDTNYTLTQRKNLTWYWENNSNELKVPINYDTLNVTNSSKTLIDVTVGDQRETITISVSGTIKPNNTYFKVAYYPVADIKVSYDNNYDANDERYYNQSGQIIDAKTSSKLILTDVLESADGTKTRQARHNTYASCLKVGQLIKIGNDIWVINQRSIDYTPASYGAKLGYYSAIYGISKDRIARSEIINADSGVIDYAPPEKNLVERNELMKDYVELSLDNVHQETPYYGDFETALHIDTDYCGMDLNFMFMARSELAVLDDRDYLVMPTLFELTKSKLVVARFPDNNFIGQRLDFVTPDYVQTTINYVEADGSAPNIYGYFLSGTNVIENNADMVGLSGDLPLLPFNNYPELPPDYFDVLEANSNWSIQVGESDGDYDKDPFEIPVFSYQFQINDTASSKGQVVLADDILETFTADEYGMRLYFLISTTTRFNNENAVRLWNTTRSASPAANFVEISRSAHLITNTLYALTGTTNTTALQGKHIGVFAVKLTSGGGFGEAKFLYAINYYQGVSNAVLPIYINNWRI